MISTRTFIKSAFNGAFGRVPAATEFNNWRASLNQSWSISGAQLLIDAKARIPALFGTAEYTARSRTDTQFINDLYLAFFARDADSTGLAFYLSILAGSDRATVLADIRDSTEFSVRVATIKPVLQFPTADIGGPVIIKFMRLDNDYDSISIIHEYDDGSAKNYLTALVPPMRWEHDYDGLSENFADMLDEHRDDAFGSTWGFDFRDRDSGILYSDVHYDNSGSGSGTAYTIDRTKREIQSRVIQFIRRPN